MSIKPMTIWCDPARVPMLEAVGAAFRARFGICVEVRSHFLQDLRKAVAESSKADGPDLVVGPHDWIGELRARQRISSFTLPNPDRFDPVAVKAFTFESALCGLPYLVESVALVYNKKLVQKPPSTWTEVLALCDAFHPHGINGLLVQLDPYHYHWLVTAHGGYLLRAKSNSGFDVGLDTPEAIAAFSQMVNLYSHPTVGLIDYHHALSALARGAAAMVVTGPWALNHLSPTDPQYGALISRSGAEFAVAPLPSATVAARPFVGAFGFMLTRPSDDSLGFIEHVATDNSMASMQRVLPHCSDWLRENGMAANISKPAKLLGEAAFRQSIRDGEIMPSLPRMAQIFEAYDGVLRQIFHRGVRDPSAAAIAAAESIRSILRQAF